MNDTPTRTMYRYVEDAFDHFNRELFDGSLPKPLLTFQRDKSCMGMFMYRRWQNREEHYTHEIALNPLYFVTRNPLELLQTIVHEMCHLWQYEYGKPSRAGYHNREWARKMEAVGLMPSDTGAPGGKTTGQHMSDYPLPGGRFYQACVVFNAAHVLPLADREGLLEAQQKARNRLLPELMQALHDALEQELAVNGGLEQAGAVAAPCAGSDNNNECGTGMTLSAGGDNVATVPMAGAAEMTGTVGMAEQALHQPFPDQFILAAANDGDKDEVVQQQAAKRAKVCYRCPACGMKVWGKPELNILCGDCQQVLLAD